MQHCILSDALSDYFAGLTVVGHALTCYRGVHTTQAGLTLFRILEASHLKSSRRVGGNLKERTSGLTEIDRMKILAIKYWRTVKMCLPDNSLTQV
jgi:hypothetical protein